MATKGSENASDELIEIKCSVCAGKNITRQAEKYCVECQDYYCIPCTDIHKAFPAMRGHKLLDKTGFRTKKTLTSLPIYPTERCPIHKAKLLDIFCENHDEVLCATCVTINHRSCQAIHSIPEEVDALYKQPLSNKIISGLNEEKQQFADIKQRKQHLITEIKKQKKIAIDSILDYKKELENELKRLECESIKLVEKEYGRIEQDLQNAIKESDKCIDEFEQTADKIQRSKGNKAQEFVNIKTAQRIICTASVSKRKLNKSVVAQIRYTVDVNIKQFLKQAEGLGHISTGVPRTTAYTVQQHSSFSAKMKSDDSICLYHSYLLEDGSLLVTDIYNKKLKRINTINYTITDDLDMEAGPIAVCQTGKQEVAVSLQNKSIAFVSLDNKMVVTRKLDMDHHCSGVAYNKDKLFVSDEGNAVYIHDMNGSMIRKITTDNSGKSIFSKSRHISVSTNREFVYVCDYNNDGLVTIDMQGIHISTFTDADMRNPQGVCTDDRGNIFVGANTSYIIQISEGSMTKIGVIKIDPYPLSVCFDANKNIIFATHSLQNSVKVYKIE